MSKYEQDQIVTEETSPMPEEGSILDLYRSTTTAHREEDQELIIKSIECGVVPHTLRYGKTNRTIRGVVKNNNDLYYFNYNPYKEFKLVKADDQTKIWEANRILRKSKLGVDIISHKDKDKKGEDTEEDIDDLKDKEPLVKEGMATAGATVAPVPEAQNIKQQGSLTTEVHPGAAGGDGTPDTHPERWHPEEATQKSTEGFWSYGDLLKSLGQQLQATAPVPSRMPTDKEKEFMVEVLGRNPDEVMSGRTQLNGTQRANFNLWLQRSLGSKLNTLKKWTGR